MLLWTLDAMPPEVLGLPSWALDGLSIGGLLSFIVVGLATSRLYTKRQVDEQIRRHDREVANLVKQHEREVADLKARYELHFKTTVELYQGRVDDARSREAEWREVATRWQSVSEMLASGLDPLQEQGETLLRILQAWQSETSRIRRELES